MEAGYPAGTPEDGECRRTKTRLQKKNMPAGRQAKVKVESWLQIKITGQKNSLHFIKDSSTLKRELKVFAHLFVSLGKMDFHVHFLP